MRNSSNTQEPNEYVIMPFLSYTGPSETRTRVKMDVICTRYIEEASNNFKVQIREKFIVPIKVCKGFDLNRIYESLGINVLQECIHTKMSQSCQQLQKFWNFHTARHYPFVRTFFTINNKIPEYSGRHTLNMQIITSVKVQMNVNVWTTCCNNMAVTYGSLRKQIS